MKTPNVRTLFERHILGVELGPRGSLAASNHALQKSLGAINRLLKTTAFTHVLFVEALDDGPEDDPLPAKFARVTQRLERLHAAIREAAQATDDQCQADEARLRDHVDAAISRGFAIDTEIKRLEHRRSTQGGEELRARRKKMQDAGVPLCDVDRLEPLPDEKPLRDRIATLRAERRAISDFIVTRDVNGLPPDFIAHVAAIRANVAHQNARVPRAA